jgi:flagellar basal-body rod protein FlgB
MNLQSAAENQILKLLQASGMRSHAIADNLANQNTPGYRRKVVQFESLLEGAIRTGNSDPAAIEPRVVEDFATPTRIDGNNVNLELESSAARENRVLTETYLTLLQAHYSMLSTAIGGGR